MTMPRETNGLHPAPLKASKDSHHVHKSCSSTSQQYPTQPLIIYTHSPRVIRARATDFMALVQKLTGLSESDKDEAPQAPHLPNDTQQNIDDENGVAQCVAVEHQHHSSCLLEDGEFENIHAGSSPLSSVAFDNPLLNSFTPEIPSFESDSLEYVFLVRKPPNSGISGSSSD